MARTQSLSRRAFFKNASAAVALLASAKSRLEAFTDPLPASGEQKTPALAQPVVEIEENVYHFEPSNNGSGPLWCHGSRRFSKTHRRGIGTPPQVQHGKRLCVMLLIS
jgi:hypothetical protein